ASLCTRQSPVAGVPPALAWRRACRSRPVPQARVQAAPASAMTVAAAAPADVARRPASGAGGRLLVVSPHFPPSAAADMHRVRMNLGRWRENGWDSEVLCVRPDRAGRAEDERLAGTVPADVEVHRVGALPETLAHGLGLSAIGLRAWGTLARAGDRLAGSG